MVNVSLSKIYNLHAHLKGVEPQSEQEALSYWQNMQPMNEEAVDLILMKGNE